MAVWPKAGAGLPYVYLFLLCRVCLVFSDEFRRDSRSLFTDYAVVHPSFHEPETNTSEGSLSNQLTIGFFAFNKTFLLKLEVNKNLIPLSYFEKHHKGGKNVIHRPMTKDKNHCHYKGYLHGFNNSWAALSLCRQISGVIYDGEELHYIEPDSFKESNRHFLYRASDMKPRNLYCGVTTDDTKSPPSRSLFADIKRHRRSTIREVPYKSTSKSRYVELVLVNDNSEFRKFNSSKEVVFERSKQIANIVNGLYSPLNIYIALVGVVVWSEHDEIKLSPDGDVTLNNFLRYRQERLATEHPNDNAQLITATTFDGSVVGKALKGPICTYKYSGGVNMDHSDLVGLVATTVAHELAHNFGMEHDSDECKCPDEKCIMAPSSSATSPKHWSSCSLEYLDIAYSHGMDYCLRNKPTEIIGPVCGNGFLEDGEECDCGLKDFCENHCCNATTCKLFFNASCAMGACCNLQTCQVKKIATVCRESSSECDFSEYCDGKSEFCPSDTYWQNGETCNNGKAFCYNGKCTSHTDQCKLLWGETGKMSHSTCYEQNFVGNVSGNCGYNRLKDSYKACNKQDVLCGMLHCAHLSEKLEYGMESAATMVRSYVNVRGKVYTCRSAIVDLGLYNSDPGLVPNGAKCGDNKICVNQKCIAIDSIREASCPLQCNGNGICNNKGNCHCSKGYNPPYCNSPGPGGSIDSGPASDYEAGYVVVVVMYIIFLGLIPLIVITGGIMYYFRSHFKTWWITKARKADIKNRANQSVPRKLQLPQKFNFDRNSLRTLEISAPIHQTASTIDSVGSVLKLKETAPACKLETVPSTRQISNNNRLKTDHPIPVRPAPPRPLHQPQRTPSWAPSNAPTSQRVARTESLKSADGCNNLTRPVSLLTSRPNCPPPRPPLPKANFQMTPKPTVQGYDNVERSVTPNSMYYDDCQTLDFSDTPLAFVHQKDSPDAQIEKNSSSQGTSNYIAAPEGDPVLLNQHKVIDKSNMYSKDISDSVKTVNSQRPRTRQPSLVASLTKKFERNNSVETNVSQKKRTPFKMRHPSDPHV